MSKIQQVYNILITPIKCTRYSMEKREKVEIYIDAKTNIIKSTQTYYPYKKFKGEALPIRLDEDMSDFACGFYEIIYKNIFPNPQTTKILNERDALVNTQYAGDTMTSVKKFQSLEDKYHCLANFWLLPMELGRTANNKWCKVHSETNTDDFMDRFLLLVKDNFETYRETYEQYFGNIISFEQFANIHFLKGSYVKENYDIKKYSDNISQNTADIVYEIIKKRADLISKSVYCEELWEYFSEYGLINHCEEYIESDEYPVDKEKYPYAYECTKCERVVKNEEMYAIPDMCDECRNG